MGDVRECVKHAKIIVSATRKATLLKRDCKIIAKVVRRVQDFLTNSDGVASLTVDAVDGLVPVLADIRDLVVECGRLGALRSVVHAAELHQRFVACARALSQVLEAWESEPMPRNCQEEVKSMKMQSSSADFATTRNLMGPSDVLQKLVEKAGEDMADHRTLLEVLLLCTANKCSITADGLRDEVSQLREDAMHAMEVGHTATFQYLRLLAQAVEEMTEQLDTGGAGSGTLSQESVELLDAQDDASIGMYERSSVIHEWIQLGQQGAVEAPDPLADPYDDLPPPADDSPPAQPLVIMISTSPDTHHLGDEIHPGIVETNMDSQRSSTRSNRSGPITSQGVPAPSEHRVPAAGPQSQPRGRRSEPLIPHGIPHAPDEYPVPAATAGPQSWTSQDTSTAPEQADNNNQQKQDSSDERNPKEKEHHDQHHKQDYGNKAQEKDHHDTSNKKGYSDRHHEKEQHDQHHRQGYGNECLEKDHHDTSSGQGYSDKCHEKEQHDQHHTQDKGSRHLEQVEHGHPGEQDYSSKSSEGDDSHERQEQDKKDEYHEQEHHNKHPGQGQQDNQEDKHDAEEYHNKHCEEDQHDNHLQQNHHHNHHQQQHHDGHSQQNHHQQQHQHNHHKQHHHDSHHDNHLQQKQQQNPHENNHQQHQHGNHLQLHLQQNHHDHHQENHHHHQQNHVHHQQHHDIHLQQNHHQKHHHDNHLQQSHHQQHQQNHHHHQQQNHHHHHQQQQHHDNHLQQNHQQNHFDHQQPHHHHDNHLQLNHQQNQHDNPQDHHYDNRLQQNHHDNHQQHTQQQNHHDSYHQENHHETDHQQDYHNHLQELEYHSNHEAAHIYPAASPDTYPQNLLHLNQYQPPQPHSYFQQDDSIIMQQEQQHDMDGHSGVFEDMNGYGDHLYVGPPGHSYIEEDGEEDATEYDWALMSLDPMKQKELQGQINSLQSQLLSDVRNDRVVGLIQIVSLVKADPSAASLISQSGLVVLVVEQLQTGDVLLRVMALRALDAVVSCGSSELAMSVASCGCFKLMAGILEGGVGQDDDLLQQALQLLLDLSDTVTVIPIMVAQGVLGPLVRLLGAPNSFRPSTLKYITLCLTKLGEQEEIAISLVQDHHLVLFLLPCLEHLEPQVRTLAVTLLAALGQHAVVERHLQAGAGLALATLCVLLADDNPAVRNVALTQLAAALGNGNMFPTTSTSLHPAFTHDNPAFSPRTPDKTHSVWHDPDLHHGRPPFPQTPASRKKSYGTDTNSMVVGMDANAWTTTPMTVYTQSSLRTDNESALSSMPQSVMSLLSSVNAAQQHYPRTPPQAPNTQAFTNQVLVPGQNYSQYSNPLSMLGQAHVNANMGKGFAGAPHTYQAGVNSYPSTPSTHAPAGEGVFHIGMMNRVGVGMVQGGKQLPTGKTPLGRESVASSHSNHSNDSGNRKKKKGFLGSVGYMLKFDARRL